MFSLRVRSPLFTFQWHLGTGIQGFENGHMYTFIERGENKNCWVGWLCIYVCIYIYCTFACKCHIYIYTYFYLYLSTSQHMPNNSTDTQHIQPVSVFVYPTLVQYTQNASESSQVLRPLQPSRWQRRWWLRAACMRLTILSIERLIRNRTSWLDFEVLPKKVQERYHVFMYIQYLNFMYIEIRHTFRFPQTKMFLGGAPNSKGANPGRYQWPTAQTWFRSRDSPDFSWQWSLLRRNSQKRTIKHCKSVVKPTWFYMYVCILHIDVILYT